MIRTLLLLALSLGITLAAPALADDKAAAKAALRESVAVIDVQKILRESKAAASIQKQIENKHKEYQDVISKEEKALRDAEKQLSQQRSILDADAYAEKRKEFEARIAKVQQDVQNKKRDLESAFAKSMETVQGEMIQIVGKLAEEKQYIMILPRSQILLVENELDVTDVVMERLNKKLPDVKVSIPAKP